MSDIKAPVKTMFSLLATAVLLAFFCDSTKGTTGGSSSSLFVTVLEVTHSARIRVVLANSSKEPVKVWKESNSWGWARWRVLVLRNGNLRTFFQNPDQDFTVNLPTFVEIPQGSRFEQRLDLNDGSWKSSDGGRVTLGPGDTAIVVYDVPFTQECLKLGVWYGVAAASTGVK